jgi:hypothetical protein
MAIIRIKRTTGNSLPTGLTFGEMAFVQGSGATANRLYIANNAGVCVWVGAQILNSPSFWSGLTAQTTIPTVQAVETRIIAGGGVTFASDLNVNIDVGKFFGKYKKGDVIPATGLTVKQVIEDALNETIIPGAEITISSSGNLESNTVPYGITSGITYTLTPRYQIKTVGAVGAGATFEWRRTGDAGWTAYSGTIVNGAETVGVTRDSSTVFNGVTLNAGGTLDSRAFEYRFTVRDSAGATGQASRTINFQSYGSPTSSITAVSPLLLTAETNSVREKGNTYSTITGTISRQRTFVPLLQWKLQYSEDTGSTWFDTNTPSPGFQTATSQSTININTFHTASVTANRIWYRVLVIDGQQQSAVTPGNQPNIDFRYRIFYGATASAPTTSTQIRGLPGVCMASGYPNPFILNTGNVFQNFVVALPQSASGISLSGAVDLDASNQDLLTDYRQNLSTISVTDRNGFNAQNYTVYRLTLSTPYSDKPNHRHEMTTVGTFS